MFTSILKAICSAHVAPVINGRVYVLNAAGKAVPKK